jgi:hypothetical protein
MNARQTLNIFVEQGIVDPTVVDDIVQEVSATGKTLCDVLVDYQAVTEEGYYQSIANAIGAEYVNLKDFTPPVGLVKMLPAGLAQLHRAFPLGFEDNILQVALIDPLNPQTVEDLRFAIGKDVHPVVAPIYQIEELIKKHYGSDAASLDSSRNSAAASSSAGRGRISTSRKSRTRRMPRRSSATWTSCSLRRSRTARATFTSSRSRRSSRSATAWTARFTRCRRRRATSQTR